MGVWGKGMNVCIVSRLFIPLPSIDKPRRGTSKSQRSRLFSVHWVPRKASEAGCFLSLWSIENHQRDGGLGEGV